MTGRILSVLAGVWLQAWLCGCSEPVEEREPIRLVRTVKVGDLTVISGREFPGQATAKQDVELSFQVSGPLITLPVDVGSKLKEGQLIAAIDPRDYETTLASAVANLERAKANLMAMERGARPEEIEQLEAAVKQAEASYAQALAEHQRNEGLIDSRAISRSEFDVSLARRDRTAAEITKAKEALNIGVAGARPEDLEAKRSEIRSLEAAVEAAKNQLNYATLLAPFDGEVAARYVNNFQLVQAKQPIVRMLDLSVIEVTVQIPESLISLIPQIKSVLCSFDALQGQEFTGIVTKIGREASQSTRTYPVIIEIKQPEHATILPGMAAMVRNHITEDVSSTSVDLIVPPSSLFTVPGSPQSFVWVVDPEAKKVSRRQVEAGELTPAGLRILEGLTAGELVVTAGVNSLREDQEVRL